MLDVELTLDTSITTVGALGSPARAAWEDAFILDLSTILGIEASRISILYIRAASVAVIVRIVDTPSVDSRGERSSLNAVQWLLTQEAGSLQVGSNNILASDSISSLPPSEPAVTPPPPSPYSPNGAVGSALTSDSSGNDGSTSTDSAGVILGGVAGGVAMVGILILFSVRYVAKRLREDLLWYQIQQSFQIRQNIADISPDRTEMASIKGPAGQDVPQIEFDGVPTPDAPNFDASDARMEKEFDELESGELASRSQSFHLRRNHSAPSSVDESSVSINTLELETSSASEDRSSHRVRRAQSVPPTTVPSPQGNGDRETSSVVYLQESPGFSPPCATSYESPGCSPPCAALPYGSPGFTEGSSYNCFSPGFTVDGPAASSSQPYSIDSRRQQPGEERQHAFRGTPLRRIHEGPSESPYGRAVPGNGDDESLGIPRCDVSIARPETTRPQSLEGLQQTTPSAQQSTPDPNAAPGNWHSTPQQPRLDACNLRPPERRAFSSTCDQCAPAAPVAGGRVHTIREGSSLESIVNSLESASGVDLDGDGDVGLPGHHSEGVPCVARLPGMCGQAHEPPAERLAATTHSQAAFLAAATHSQAAFVDAAQRMAAQRQADASHANWHAAQHQLSEGMGCGQARELPAECVAAAAFEDAAQRMAAKREAAPQGSQSSTASAAVVERRVQPDVPGGRKYLIREGSNLESIVNSLETASGVDLDGNGTIGMPGHHSQATNVQQVNGDGEALTFQQPASSSAAVERRSQDPPHNQNVHLSTKLVREPGQSLGMFFGFGQDALVVTNIELGSPAALAGMQEGDVVSSIDGVAVNSKSDLAILMPPMTNTFQLGVVRSSQHPMEAKPPALPVTAPPFSTELRRSPGQSLGMSIEFNSAGEAIIAEVDNDSPAERANLQEGDRIVDVDGIEATVNTMESLFPPLRNVFELGVFRLADTDEDSVDGPEVEPVPGLEDDEHAGRGQEQGRRGSMHSPALERARAARLAAEDLDDDETRV